jgi:hypothetical protein
MAGPSAVVPAGAVGPHQGSNQPAGFSAPAAEHTVYPPVHRVPATRGDRPYPAEPEQRVLAPGAASRGPQPAPPQIVHPAAQNDRFAELGRKLREAGATYYLLETWGNDGHSYRFHCRMALGNDPNNTQPFEATAADALEAMSRVVEQVEAWRAGR